MTICPLRSVGGISFGADRLALSVFGAPVREGRNRLGEDEVAFANAVYRFVAGRLVEVSFQLPTEIAIDGEIVAGDALVAFLRQHDPGFRERHGFAIAPTFGLAVDLDHDDHWVSAFVAGRWDKIK